MPITADARARPLREALPGRMILPGDERWDDARSAWNLHADLRPAAVATPASAAEAAAVVRAAARQGLRVAPLATGHAAAAMGPLDDAVLLRTSELSGVAIDAAARRARAGAGALWIEVVEPASAHGLAALAGSSPDVGVVGYSLGGGVGWLARRHGLAANAVLGAEVVMADGTLARVDHDHEPELFWALRGGGGSFALVTALELALFPAPDLVAGALMWPWERAAEVLHAWREWIPSLPDEATSVGRILHVPPFPEVPPPLRGRRLALVEVAVLGDPALAGWLLRPLRALRPELDTVARVAPAALSRLHMDPERPVPGLHEHALLSELPAEAVDRMVAAAGPGSGSRILALEVRHLGGALARPAPGGGALDRLEGAAIMLAAGLADGPDAAAALSGELAALRRALAPWDTGRGYLNFADRPGLVPTLFDEETLRRLRAVKARVDPGDLFRANHPIPPEPG